VGGSHTAPGRYRVKNGAPWLKPVLVQCAWVASRKKNSYFEAQYLRLKARRGPKKAVVAVAASILTTVYHMLADGTCYQDLGADHFARRNPARTAAKLASRIRNLGFTGNGRARLVLVKAAWHYRHPPRIGREK